MRRTPREIIQRYREAFRAANQREAPEIRYESGFYHLLDANGPSTKYRAFALEEMTQRLQDRIEPEGHEPVLKAGDILPETREIRQPVEAVRALGSDVLAEMCREVTEWHRTGILRQDGELVKFAATAPQFRHCGDDERVRVAERAVIHEVVRRFPELVTGS